MDILNCSLEQWLENEDNYLKHLREEDVWDRVPLLNVNDLHRFKNGSLVRFRGMVQDMHGPEYYLEKFVVFDNKTQEKKVNCGKYRDFSVSTDDERIEFDNDKNITGERQKYVVISVPGVNDWVQQFEREKYQIKALESCSGKTGTKRSFEEDSLDNVKAAKTQPAAPKSSSLSQDHILNFPIPTSNGKCCHLRVYRDTDSIKLNDTYEFAGFLSMDPLVESFYDNDDIESKMEIQTHHPPSSLVPSIHAVHHKKLQHLVANTTILNAFQMSAVKKELLIVLTQILLGDSLAAEYLICHFMSEIYMRREFMPLGKFSLNISNIPTLQNVDYVAEIYRFIQMLLPKSFYLPMTLDNMNSMMFTPKKDYECNRLTSGVLQLSTNTILVLDETKLTEGKLNSGGINNIKALSHAIKNQKVVYDFNYYPIEYDCDIPFLILSEGKSMLPSDTHLPLKYEESHLRTFLEITEAARHFLNPQMLNDIRTYLSQARTTRYDISDEAQNLVQEEFVEMRQEAHVTADDLHNLLVLSRLICISEGKDTLDAECWRKACDMEKERQSRIPK